jgi:hypothetical protein
MKRTFWLVICGMLALGAIGSAHGASAATGLPQVQPTVTGTPSGPTILVPEMSNVRSGPDTSFDQIGVLIAGQVAPVIGRSAGGNWLQIVYLGVPGDVGWVYAPFVVLQPPGVTLPIIEPPPTSTPRVTRTIDPTFAAQFNLGEPTATRLPTFTPPGPVVQATLPPPEHQEGGGFPPMLAILAFLVVGLFGTVISFLRGG